MCAAELFVLYQARERQRQEEQERQEREAAEAERKRKEEEEARERAAREAAEREAALAKMREEKLQSLGPEPAKGPDVTQVIILFMSLLFKRASVYVIMLDTRLFLLVLSKQRENLRVKYTLKMQ